MKLSSVSTVTERPGALVVSHLGQFPATTISFNLAKGASLGQAVNAIESAQKELALPASVRLNFQGAANAFRASLTNTLLLILGFPLGFCMSAIFSGFGSYLSELYPTAVRGTGQGFTYNTGRAVGAVFPTLVGYLADSWGVGGALVFGALGYGLAALALLGLPETRGKELR